MPEYANGRLTVPPGEAFMSATSAWILGAVSAKDAFCQMFSLPLFLILAYKCVGSQAIFRFAQSGSTMMYLLSLYSKIQKYVDTPR